MLWLTVTQSAKLQVEEPKQWSEKLQNQELQWWVMIYVFVNRSDSIHIHVVILVYIVIEYYCTNT